MKQILSISCNDKEFNISIDGENHDLLIGIAQVLREVEKASNYTLDEMMNFLKNYVEDYVEDDQE